MAGVRPRLTTGQSAGALRLTWRGCWRSRCPGVASSGACRARAVDLDAPVSSVTRSERFLAELGRTAEAEAELDRLYKKAFGQDVMEMISEGLIDMEEGLEVNSSIITKTARSQPEVFKEIVRRVEKRDADSWTRFQREAAELRTLIIELKAGEDAAETEWGDAEEDEEDEETGGNVGNRIVDGKVRRIVLITGFESFNVGLYKRVGDALLENKIELSVFSDRDITERKSVVEKAIKSADVFFGSLLFDFDQVEWLKQQISPIQVRVIFESSLELMSDTQIGSFEMANQQGKKSGPPPAVKALLSKFGSGREEDKLVGYISFLKFGPQLLRFIPGKKARDLRNWLQTYAYWNQGGPENVRAALQLLVQEYYDVERQELPKVVETPDNGVLHPDYDGYFENPSAYMDWYKKQTQYASTKPIVAILIFKKHVITKQPYIQQMVRSFEQQDIIPVPIFINGVEAHTIVRDQLTSIHEIQRSKALAGRPLAVDAIVNTIGFPLVGGPAGTMEGARQAEIARELLKSKNIPYTVAAPLLIQDISSWVRDGIQGLQSVVLYSLPELDGAIDSVPLGGLVKDDIFLAEERLQRLGQRLKNWVEMKKKRNEKKKVAIMLYGFPPGVGATGTAALLNVPKSLESLLGKLREEGYTVPDDVDGEALVSTLAAMLEPAAVSKGAKGIKKSFSTVTGGESHSHQIVAEEISSTTLRSWLTFPREWGPTEWGPMSFLPDANYLHRKLIETWGTGANISLGITGSGASVVSGVQLGNVFIGVQPLLGIEGDPMRLLFERDLTPHPQYVAFYLWIQRQFNADAIVHFGMHGTVEWLPGSPLGNTGLSWPDVLVGDLPNAYIYAANNPSESVLAKRRAYGTLVSYNVPPYARSGVYNKIQDLRDFLAQVNEDSTRLGDLRQDIVSCVIQTGIYKDKPPSGCSGAGDIGIDSFRSTVEDMADEAFLSYCKEMLTYLQEIENRLFSEGLHVLGMVPDEKQLLQYLEAYYGDKMPSELLHAIAHACARVERDGRTRTREELSRSVMEVCSSQETTNASGSVKEMVDEAVEICSLLNRNVEELDGVCRVLSGGFLEPEAGGDLLRDGPGVLPTGKNIFSLDPYRMPSPTAMARGTAAARSIIDQHRKANGGAFPETVSVALWGLDAIKTKGESVAIVLGLVGARPVKEGTGRIVRFELIPLDELSEMEGMPSGTRPRVDVFSNMSGIFRDSFQNVVELLDDMFQAAGKADEPVELNYIRKHVLEMKENNIEGASARLFSNPAGDFGSMVNERVGSGDWEQREELGGTWASRNAFSYGRGKENGRSRPAVLNALLESTDRIVQEIDSVEYGLTDIQEYYANTGALKAAAETARKGKSVDVSIVETFTKDGEPVAKDLEETLRLEYRSKLLNPRWAKAMAAQGSGGAYEISQRMTAMVGWSGTAKFAEDWTYDQAVEQYVLDEEMASTLRKNNPQAFANIVKRSLEAHGRKFWNADEELIQRLKSLYSELDSELERVE